MQTSFGNSGINTNISTILLYAVSKSYGAGYLSGNIYASTTQVISIAWNYSTKIKLQNWKRKTTFEESFGRVFIMSLSHSTFPNCC